MTSGRRDESKRILLRESGMTCPGQFQYVVPLPAALQKYQFLKSAKKMNVFIL